MKNQRDTVSTNSQTRASRKIRPIRLFLLAKAACVLLVLSVLLPGVEGIRAEEVQPDRQEALITAMAEHLTCYPLELLDFHKQEPLISVKELCLASIYHNIGSRPLWITVDGPDDRARAILDRLKRSDLEGLNSQDYEIDLLDALWPSLQPEDLARLDTQLTFSLVKYIHDLSYGQMKLKTSEPELFAEAGDENFDPVKVINIVRQVPDIGAYLDSLVPQHPSYRKLRRALVTYRELAQKPGLPVIPSGPLLRPGKTDSRVAVLQQRLMMTGESSEVDQTGDLYDERLVAAVREYQEKNGLRPDGIVGPQTLSMLNRAPADLVDTIKVNMARWHVQAHDLGTTYIMVNIADFSLKAVRNGETALEMPVIVGKFQHQTPVFSDHIRYLEFNPYWNVTPSIARNEDLPGLRKDPRHLVDRHIRLFSSWLDDAVELDSTVIDWENVSRSQMSRYKLRQDPGPWNALGRVKFVFPNHHSVYLHDTPTQDLFDQTSRSFSHGCIRVSQPLELATFCLAGQKGWDREAIDRVVAKGERRIISLRTSIPIHITYQTAWVDNSDIIHFNSDIYGRDAKLLKTLVAKE